MTSSSVRRTSDYRHKLVARAFNQVTNKNGSKTKDMHDILLHVGWATWHVLHTAEKCTVRKLYNEECILIADKLMHH